MGPAFASLPNIPVSESCYRYERKLGDDIAEIAEWLVKLTSNRRTWSFGLCYLYLRNVKGFGWNHKRVYRIYCKLELNLRIRPKKRLKRGYPQQNAYIEQYKRTVRQEWLNQSIFETIEEAQEPATQWLRTYQQ